MRDEQTNVTINDRRGLEDLLGGWEQVVPIFNWESEHNNKADNEDSGESCPDYGRDLPLRFRWRRVIIRASLSTQERVSFAWGACSLLCVASSHGVDRGLDQGRWTEIPRFDRQSLRIPR